MRSESGDVAISVKNLSKTYRLFAHPGDRVKQFFSLGAKRYHREFTALRDVSFDIKKGETVGIIGRNGSGKSTLLQLICGILQPSAGSVQVHGRIAALLELGAGFNPEFTGRENVYFYGALQGLNRAQMDARFDDIAAFADIGDFIDQPVRVYSSGMFVRLAFATMINADADILIVDEALAIGDEAFQQKCFDKLSEFLRNPEKVVFLVSHNIRQLERLCSRILMLDAGKLLKDGTAQAVCNAYLRHTQDQHHKSRIDTARPPQIDTGVVDVKKVCIGDLGSAAALQEVLAHSAMTVSIAFRCHTPLPAADIILEIQSTERVAIMAANTGRSPEDFNLAAGDHTLECIFPSVPLMPGSYQLKLVFLDRYRRFLWEDQQLCPFRILAAPDSNSIRMPTALVDMPFEWRRSAS